MRPARRLELGHVAAVELEVLGVGQRVTHVAGEPDRDDPVLAAPHEQRLALQLAQTGPERVGILEVDVPRRG